MILILTERRLRKIIQDEIRDRETAIALLSEKRMEHLNGYLDGIFNPARDIRRVG